MKLCSACLVGINCKWNGKSNSIPKLIKKFRTGELLAICPEQLGGLATPRPPCGILNATGKEVIINQAKVINHKGKNYTKEFLKGSKKVLKIAKELGIKEAILKRTSPCCGVKKTWQMRRQGNKYKNYLVDGDGVLTALLKRNGLKVISEKDL